VAYRYPELAWDFALAHRDAVNERVDATSRSQYYPMLAASSGKQEMIDKVQAFADQYLDKGSRRTAETAMASIRNRIKVRDEQLPAIDAWLAKNGGGKSAGKTARR
jgi:aminopeptidase N